MAISAIMIDSREPVWVQKLEFGGIPTSVTFLEHGDAMLACDDGELVLVERKTPDDMLGSLRDERLLPQVSQMQFVTRWNYLLITGDLQRGPNGNIITDRGQTGWSWAAVQGALLTIQEQGTFVIFAAGDSDYETAILRLGNRDRKTDLLLAPPIFPRILNAQEAVIASLPGIGVERLQAVMQHCGTPAWALVALTDISTQIPGIPKNVKTKVRAALALKDDEQLAVYTEDNPEGNGLTDQEKLVVTKLGGQ